MSELHVSPLLDAMTVGPLFSRHGGVFCYSITHPDSGREFVLKHISVPASQEQVQALLLTGAYTSEEEADNYYRKEAEALVHEAEERNKLLDCPYILPFLGVQMEKKPEGVGYDVYAVLPKRSSLQSFLEENAVSHLRGINMGIDLCVALAALREEGFVHGNLKPTNVFLSDTGRFLLGDFGLISTKDMQYAVIPEQYRTGYTAPELRQVMGGLNLTVDTYSLGMILYRIYNGNHAPFEDEQNNAKTADTRRLEGEELPAPIYADYELAAIILKACAYDPAQRFQTPDEMRLELEQYMRRNAVNDHLIVPPLVTDGEILTPEAAAEPVEPIRFADVEAMDEGFKKAFAPEEKPGKQPEPEASPAPEPSPEPKPEPEKPSKEEADAQKTARRGKRIWRIFSVAMILVVLLIGLYEFTGLGQGLWHYFVTVDRLEVSDITADSLQLHLATNVNADDFTAVCQDTYGNSFHADFRQGVAAFTGLNPGTQYTLKVDLEGMHRISGTTSVTAATLPQVEVLTFSAADGSEEGAVLLTLVIKDENTEPESWTLGVTGPDGLENLQTFSGHSYQVAGLEPGTEYSFRLVGSETLYLTGQLTAAFTPSRAVQAEGLALDSIQDGAALISWRCSSQLPEQWELVCTDPAGQELPVTLQPDRQEAEGYICSARIPNVVPEVRYQLRLSAPGLFQPLTLEFADETVYLENLAAAQTDTGLELTWAASREPEGGWKVTAAYGQGQEVTDTVRGGSCSLMLIPETEYTLTVAPADGSNLSGTDSITARTGAANRINLFGVTGSGTTIGTYNTPTGKNWTARDLRGGTVRYRKDDSITFLITAGSNPANSDETVTVQYVVRDSSGGIVNVQQTEAAWSSLWEGRQWYEKIPWLPDTPGSYSFTVYVNSQRVGTINFTMVS